jgi:hypothetical protein
MASRPASWPPKYILECQYHRRISTVSLEPARLAVRETPAVATPPESPFAVSDVPTITSQAASSLWIEPLTQT